MSGSKMETHGDMSGGWVGYEFPEVSRGYQPFEDTSGVAYDDRSVDLGTKNAGVTQYLRSSDMPMQRERTGCVDLTRCYGACDGHIEVEEELRPVSRDNVVSDIGQLALF